MNGVGRLSRRKFLASSTALATTAGALSGVVHRNCAGLEARVNSVVIRTQTSGDTTSRAWENDGLATGGRARTAKIEAGDVGYVQPTLPHYMENSASSRNSITSVQCE